MKGFSQANAGQYYPTEIARDITNAYSRMGMAQAQLENKREQEAREKKERKKQLKTMAIILGAAALTGGAAALAAPAAAGVAGGAAAAGGASAAGAGAGAAGAAGAGAAGAAGAGAGAASGGFMAGLGTFGQGALGALTGSGSVAPGVGGLAGGLSTGAGFLGQIGTSMLTSGGEKGVEDAAMGALGSYMQQSQAANKSSRAMEGMLKDPTARSALFPGVDQQQTDAILQYKNTLGTIEGASFLQQALPMLSKFSTSNMEYNQQQKLQRSRIAQQGDVDLSKIGASAMIDAYGKMPIIPAVQPTTGVTFSPIKLGITTGAQGTGL